MHGTQRHRAVVLVFEASPSRCHLFFIFGGVPPQLTLSPACLSSRFVLFSTRIQVAVIYFSRRGRLVTLANVIAEGVRQVGPGAT